MTALCENCDFRERYPSDLCPPPEKQMECIIKKIPCPNRRCVAGGPRMSFYRKHKEVPVSVLKRIFDFVRDQCKPDGVPISSRLWEETADEILRKKLEEK